MKKTVLCVLILVACLSLASRSWAQAGIYIGVHAGVDTQTPKITGIQFNSDTGFLYGVRAGIQILMLAAEVNYSQAAHNISLNGNLLSDWNNRQVDYSYIGVNLKFIFSLPILHPYLTGGYGYYTENIHSIEQKRNGGYNFGAGVELKLGRIALLAEGKYNHVNLDIQNNSLSLGDFTFVGGLNFYF
jgi:opacity protein-like surface antigen